MKKPEILYSPQECDRDHCHDDDCPYLHSPMWQYRNEDMTLSDGFDSEQEAIDAYHLHVKRKEFSIGSSRNFAPNGIWNTIQRLRDSHEILVST